ncbi:hypothetical protein GGH94_002878 [Coemansia aciculifera]|uniref:ABC transmembrane type-1 domain-containing protein n=1 Tax=Coemansia aciculifera TaxID=417176 RepID=A0A9W8M6R7_9FUNG|nr:hypothetical protein GGH94_002878 [Coemansia aciculifera]KAJ2873034.1 hypothetical protein GGH93_003546 [Coemansia aciculifera]
MDFNAPDQVDLNKGDGDSAEAQVAENELHAALATHTIAAPDKTYAAAVVSSPSVAIAAGGVDVDANPQQRDNVEYYSDEYTEDSIFSDSIYDDDDEDGSNESSVEDTRDVDVEQAEALPNPYDSRLSSGATSPNLTRTAEALAPSHRFVSHTPWGTSTGRLTRDQRHKGRLWDDPNADSTAPKGEFTPAEHFPTFVDNDRASAANSLPSGTKLAVEADHADAAVSSREQIARLTHQLHYQQQRLHQMQAQMRQQQQFSQQLPTATAAAADQVVNVVSVHQGTKNYSQLQQQMQREQRLQQDTIEGKLMQGQRAPRIVTIAQFVKSVSRLLSIGFPSAGCTEARLTVALVAVLGVRTGLDVWFSNFNARSVRAVVTYDRATLLRRLLPEYLGMMVPMAAVNQAIKWVISSLTIALRVRLGRYAHERYVDGITNITWNQLHRQGPNGSTPAYERPDWLLTVQIHRFADMFPRLIADVVKPTMDWFVFSRLLSKFIGRKGSLAMVCYVVLASAVIRLSSPPTGKHASRLAQLEEKYRGVYARVSTIIQRAAAASTPLLFGQQQQQKDEEITRLPNTVSPNLTPQHIRQQRQGATFVPRVQAAFRQRARESLDSSLDSVAANVVSINIRRFFGGIGETILAKYGATLMAYYLLSRPLCTPGRRLASDVLLDPAAVMMSYSRNSAYLINLSQATTRLLLMLNDLPKFVWSTVKVDRLLRSLDVHARYRSAVENLSEYDGNNTNHGVDDDDEHSSDSSE